MRKLTSGIAAAVLAIAGVLVAGPAEAATAAEYVALGDSYASGVGSLPYDSAGGTCLRSPNSYPRLWAAGHPNYALKDVTCSGATIQDVRNNQLSALSGSTSLVTITVGGNDDQFTPVVQGCLTKDDNWCTVATLWMSSFARNQLSTNLAALFADIKARAPKALVLVFGYPRLVAATGSCGVLDLTPAKRAALNANADALAEGTQAAATSAGVYYIDMRKQFTGHEACGTDAWINGVDLSHVTETFHPNTAGYQKGYAARFSATWG